MFDIVSKRYSLFLISALVIVLSIISLASPFGRLKLSTEFSSGSRMRIGFEQQVSQSDLRQEIAQLGYSNIIIQNEIKTTGQGDFLIRTPILDDVAKANLVSGLEAKFGSLEVKEFSNVSPEVATETLRTAAIAVLIAVVGMLLYIVWAFRSMPHPFRYGTAAIGALAHDILISVGIFSVLGGFLGWEVNMMFVIGVLTVLGYSINNMVVIFDRIRENVRNGISPYFEVVVNNSVVETMGRTLNTSITTLIGILALMLFVGASIQNFVVVLMVGIIAGVFDSICVAPMMLVVWDKHEWKNLIPFRAKA